MWVGIGAGQAATSILSTPISQPADRTSRSNDDCLGGDAGE